MNIRTKSIEPIPKKARAPTPVILSTKTVERQVALFTFIFFDRKYAFSGPPPTCGPGVEVSIKLPASNMTNREKKGAFFMPFTNICHFKFLTKMEEA